MAFVTEKISSQDIQKYDLLEVNKKLNKNLIGNWTIDREREIYLCNIGHNWQEPNESDFILYWKGHLIRISLRTLPFDGVQDGPAQQTLELITIPKNSPLWLPSELESERTKITNDLKEAIIAYETFQCGCQYTSYIATFKF